MLHAECEEEHISVMEHTAGPILDWTCFQFAPMLQM
jgi:hypothetical protein